jgi:osmotically-inducible protein OsmY
MPNRDEKIRIEVERLAADMGEDLVICDVEDGEVLIEGPVMTDERSYQLEHAVRALPGVVAVRNELTVEGFEATVGNVADGLELSPDFTSSTGADDAMESVSEAEPYFPPTDPVTAPGGREGGGVDIVGGFAETAGEDAAAAAVPGAGLPRGDDEIRDSVIAALRADAATTDLDIQVIVRDGVVVLRGSVASMDEADLAESVAARVPGIEEVREELDVQGM